MLTKIPIAIMVKMVPTAAVDSSKKLSGIVNVFILQIYKFSTASLTMRLSFPQKESDCPKGELIS